MHLATSDLQLRLWHCAHLEVLRPSSPCAHDGWQGHCAQLCLAYTVKLLLQDSQPETGRSTRSRDAHGLWECCSEGLAALPPCMLCCKLGWSLLSTQLLGSSLAPGELTSLETRCLPAWGTPHPPPVQSGLCSSSAEGRRKCVSQHKLASLPLLLQPTIIPPYTRPNSRFPCASWRQLEGASYTPLRRGAGCHCPSQHSLTFLRMISM